MIEFSGQTKAYVNKTKEHTQNLDWIKSVVAKREDDGQFHCIGSSKAKSIACLFRCKPDSTFTCFYRRVEGSKIIVLGIGETIGASNKKCKVHWADGSHETINLDSSEWKKNAEFKAK